MDRLNTKDCLAQYKEDQNKDDAIAETKARVECILSISQDWKDIDAFNFSNVDTEFIEKNKDFLRTLFKTKKYKLLTNKWEADYYSLILIEDKNWEKVIPVPVLMDILYIWHLKSDDGIYDLETMEKLYSIKRVWEEEREEINFDEIIDEEATLEMFENRLEFSPYFSSFESSLWVDELFTRFTIVDKNWNKFMLNNSENISNGYWDNAIVTEAPTAISQIIKFLEENWKDSISSIIFEEQEYRNYNNSSLIDKNYSKEFTYSEIENIIKKYL